MNAGMVATICLGAVGALVFAIYIGGTAATLSIQTSCDKLGAFHTKDAIYECKRRSA